MFGLVGGDINMLELVGGDKYVGGDKN